MAVRLDIARTTLCLNRCEQGIKLCRDVVAWARAAQEKALLAEGLGTLGPILTALDPSVLPEAVQCMEESLSFGREVESDLYVILGLQHLGLIAILQGDYDRGIVNLEESLLLAQEMEFHRWIGQALFGLGYARLQQGQISLSTTLCTESIRHFQQAADQVLVVYPTVGLAAAALAQGDCLRAARLLGRVELLLEETGTTVPPVFAKIMASVHQGVVTQMEVVSFTAALAEGKSTRLEHLVVDTPKDV